MSKDKQCRDGMFVVTPHKSNPANPGDIREYLHVHSPQGRIDRLRGMAAQVEADVPELDQAQGMVTSGVRSSKQMLVFSKLLNQAEKTIQAKAIERSEGYLLPLAEMGGNHSKAQSKRAQNPRGKASSIIHDLAGPAHDWWTTQELWNEFISRLDKSELDPKEHCPNRKNPKTWYLKFGADGSYKFTSFKAALSRARRNQLTQPG